ncbi:Gp37-like protein [Streptomyces sp. cg35]|uniref:Gp37-like protein n=1 Tax=Streptomyces sp. cg35 TaxID=3421650 RepID=UPI003D1781BF
MPDTYANWAALAAAETAGVDYRIEVRTTDSDMSHIAIHGGGIEGGTTELANATALATGGQYYSMLGLKNTGNSVLHITSTHFDEPQAVAMQNSVYYTVSYHGYSGDERITHLGGADLVLRDEIGAALSAAGFAVDIASTEIDGNDPLNITQRNRRGLGVQLELSRGQRAAFFPGGDLSRAMRESGQRTPAFRAYVAALASVLSPPADDGRLRVFARDQNLQRIGRIDDHTTITVVPRKNAIGAYTLEISADSPQTGLLVEGNGLIVQTSRGDTVLSGPIRTVDWARSATEPGKLTVGGVDDTEVLSRYTCWPNPTSAIGSQTASVYKISTASTETGMRDLVNLNAGPGAQASRKHPLLTLATNGLRGPALAREVNQFDNLLTVLQDIANAANLGFRVIQVASNLQFQVYTPADRSGTARFSFGLGNLTDASYSTTPPTCTRAVVVAGGGTSPRVCKTYDRADPLFPGLVLEQFVDQTSVDTASVDLAAQMDQAGAEALTNGAGKGSLAVSPVDIPELRYGRDYNVGDVISAQLRGGDWYTDTVGEVTLTDGAADGTQVKATIGGDASDTVVARIYSYIAQLKKGLGRLQTRKAA